MRRPTIAMALGFAITVSAAGSAWSDGEYAPPPAGAYNWSGFYIGGTAGYANGDHSSDDVAGAFLGYPDLANGQSHGFAGGGTLGVNWQAGSLVYGLETLVAEQ